MIKTPQGVLSAVTGGDAEFPGIRVYLNNRLISVTEYTSIHERVQTIAYGYSSDPMMDEPQIEYVNATQIDVLKEHLKGAE